PTSWDAGRPRAEGARAGVPRARARTAVPGVHRSWKEPTTYTCQLLSCMFTLDAGDTACLPAAPAPAAGPVDGARARLALRGLRADDPPRRRVARGCRRAGGGRAGARGGLPAGRGVPHEAHRPHGCRGG